MMEEMRLRGTFDVQASPATEKRRKAMYPVTALLALPVAFVEVIAAANKPYKTTVTI